ncbi:C-type mannose receptor 2-like isoform X2 [Dunckerocampus dactyliophorus]|uniref:C-type mannose receptor 2-like isoform X2 n=1 Tax=Dunckerocampus dactyliophorus TaxID=161453 RepID=UPI0024070481|nr:C-type mannose receptor 2-like isoform X2 [Dunckerocampus dactyliophorus]
MISNQMDDVAMSESEESLIGEIGAVEEKDRGSRSKLMSWIAAHCQVIWRLMGFFMLLLCLLAAIFVINSQLDELMDELIITQKDLEQQIAVMLMKMDELQKAHQELKQRLASTDSRQDNLNQVWLEQRHLNTTLNTMLMELNNFTLLAGELAQCSALLQSCEGIKENVTKMTASVNSHVEETKREGCCGSMSQTLHTLQQETDQLTEDLSTLTAQQTKHYELLCIIVHKDNLTDTLRQEINCCDRGWEPHSSHCYYLSDKKVNQEKARKECGKSAQLAEVDDTAEQKFITRLVYNAFQERVKKDPNQANKYGGNAAWIGLMDTEQNRDFRWQDNRKLSHLNFWQPGEPNNNDGDQYCVVIIPPDTMVDDEFDEWDDTHYKRWDDLSCRNKRYYLCRKKNTMG